MKKKSIYHRLFSFWRFAYRSPGLSPGETDREDCQVRELRYLAKVNASDCISMSVRMQRRE